MLTMQRSAPGGGASVDFSSMSRRTSPELRRQFHIEGLFWGRLSFSRPHLGDRLRLVEVRGLFREEWTKLQNAEARFKGRVAKHELTSLYCSLLSQPRKVQGTCLGSRVALAGFSFPSKPS